MASEIYVRPFAYIQLNPVISDEIISQLINESTARLEQITNNTEIPNIRALNTRGFQGLKDISLFPPSNLQNATSRFLSGIAGSMRAPLRKRFLEICCINGVFISDFMSVVRCALLPADLKRLTDDENQFGEKELRKFIYALYQDPVEAQEWFKERKYSANIAVEALTAVVNDYAQRFEQLARFLLYEPWFDNTSIVDFLTAYWGKEFGFRDVSLDIVPLGFPDAYYRVSWAHRIGELFQAHNSEGSELLSGLSLKAATALTAGLHAALNVEIDEKEVKYRVISWDYLKGLGFFRPENCAQIDACTPILEIVEVLAHELTHHVYHSLTDTSFFMYENALCYINSPCLNEGFAEYHTQLCLEELFKDYPELDYFRLVRRFLLHGEDHEDPHVSGAALMNSGDGCKFEPDDLYADMHELHKPPDFKIESVQITPGFRLSLEPERGQIAANIIGMEIPGAEFIQAILHDCTSRFASLYKLNVTTRISRIQIHENLRNNK